jgi:hypothetical protein
MTIRNYPNMRKFIVPRILYVACVSILATGCGGGVDGPSTLSPSLYYPDSVASVWEKSTVAAKISGLEGQKATCYWDSAKVQGPPGGITIDAGTCNVNVDAAIPGIYNIYVRMDVKGYSGSGSTSFKIDALGPKLSYKALDSVLPSEQIQWLRSITPDAGKPILGDYTAVAGDIVTYKNSGNFPVGVSMDSNGNLTGMPTNSGGYHESKIRAEIQRGNRVVTVYSWRQGAVQVGSPDISFTDFVAKVTEPSSKALPITRGLLPTDSYYYEKYAGVWLNCPQTNSAPVKYGDDGIVDPTTGATRPLATAAGSYCVTVALVVNRDGQVARFPSNVKFKIQ